MFDETLNVQSFMIVNIKARCRTHLHGRSSSALPWSINMSSLPTCNLHQTKDENLRIPQVFTLPN